MSIKGLSNDDGELVGKFLRDLRGPPGQKPGLEILQHMRLVLSVAQKYRVAAAVAGLSLMDLIQEGYFGLVRADQKFDPTRDIKFGTYARWWIMAAITRAIDRSPSQRGVRVASGKHEQIRNLGNLEREMTEALGQPPEKETLIAAAVERMSLERWQIVDLLEYRSRRVARLSGTGRPDQNGDDELTLEDILTSDHPTPDEEATDHELIRMAGIEVSWLKQSHYIVICLRFGLLGNDTHSLQEIGTLVLLSRERVRQIERDALHELRLVLVESEPKAAK